MYTNNKDVIIYEKSALVKFRMGDYECPLGVFMRDDKSNCNEIE